MQIMGPVLFVANALPTSDHALREAAGLARAAGAPLVVCHVLPEVVGFRPLFPQLRVFDREAADQIREWAGNALGRQLDRVLGASGPRPEILLESGSAHAVVIEIADQRDAGLIVVGGDDRSPAGAGTSIERIARHARCPVLLSMDRKGKAVLAATDFSDPALPAVSAGQEEAERLGLPLYVLHAVDFATASLGLPEIVSPSYIAEVIAARREDARSRLEELSKRMGGGLVLLREGPASDSILEAAESIDAALVILGTHGRTGISRFALGSVAEAVLRGARRSTLVVPLGA